MKVTQEIILKKFKRYLLKDLKCVSIGKIVKIHEKECQVDIELQISTEIDDKWQKPPILDSVPFILPYGNNGGLQVPLSVNDFAIVLFADLNFDKWKLFGKQEEPAFNDYHSFNNAIAIPFVYNQKNSEATNYNQDKTMLSYRESNISLKEDSIDIKSNKDITIESDLVSLELKNNKIKLGTQATDVLDIISDAIDLFISFQSTPAVNGSPVTTSPITIAKAQALKAKLDTIKK